MEENIEKNDLMDKVGEMKEKAGEMLNKATDKAGEVWDKTEDKAEEVWDEVKEKAGNLAEGAKGLWNKIVDKFDGDEPKPEEPKV